MSKNPIHNRQDKKRYYSLNDYLREHYGEKLYKIALNANMTCPNRDGTLGRQGCIFCSAGGSGDFASDSSLTITEQIETGKAVVSSKHTGGGYIAYFQAYTNTYAPLPYLRAVFTEALSHPDVRILSIATRPDCLESGVLSLLNELNRIKPVWVELGLQTIHPKSAAFIRRGYDLPVFERAVQKLREINIDVIVHTILALPGESKRQILETMEYLNRQEIQGIKLQLLHVLKGTGLALYYQEHPFWIPSMDEYFELLGACICRLRPDITVHRLTGDGPKSLLIEPAWTGNKRQVLNGMKEYFKKHDIWQGRSYSHGTAPYTL